MGLFSAIGGAISSACSAIGSALGGACRAIGGAISNVCSAIGLGGFGEAAKGFMERIGNILPDLFQDITFGEIIDGICRVIGAIAEALGLKQPEKDEPEDLGLKAEEADKKPEDFESIEAYINYLHNEIKVDEEKKKNLSPEEKAVYQGIGNALYLDAAKEKLGVSEISPELLVDAVKLKMDATEILAYINKLKGEGITDQKDMSKYLHGQECDNKDKVQSSMVDAIKELNPEMSENDIADKILDMREAIKAEG